MQNMKKNEKAVSPVLGVILMVAITVIVAAVVAAFVFGIGAPAKAPQASLQASACEKCNSGNPVVTITHQGGDNLVLSNTKVTFNPDIYGSGAWEDMKTLALADGWTLSSGTTGITTLNPGDVATKAPTTAPSVGNTAEVKVIDVPTGKLILDTKIVATS